jgi:hypothetical protein
MFFWCARVLACFDPQWPNLNYAVACFEIENKHGTWIAVETSEICRVLFWVKLQIFGTGPFPSEISESGPF